MLAEIQSSGATEDVELRIELSAPMDQHNYGRIEEFRSKMSMDVSEKPEYYERLQYIKVFVGLEKGLSKQPQMIFPDTRAAPIGKKCTVKRGYCRITPSCHSQIC